MFDKIKSRKAPISLSSVSNAIKSSGTPDLTPPDFQPKQIDAYIAYQLGIPRNSIVAVAYDPVQSLLAISTCQDGKTEVRVYGQNFVEVVFEFKQTSPMTKLMFIKGVYLVAVLPIGGGVTVISLHSKTILGTFSPPGTISSVLLDPGLDWLVVGLANGQTVFYDVDRLNLTPFRIDNLQKRVLPKQRLLPVVHMEWHPRDIGTLLITYSHCSIIYSMVTGEVVSVFVYELHKGERGFEMSQSISNGGKKKLFSSSSLPVILEVCEAHFHPNGLHVVTLHRDGSFVFWDAQDGTLLQARTMTELALNKQGPSVLLSESLIFSPDGFDIHGKWVCSTDPEETQLLIAIEDTIHVLDFGYTLKYSLTSHEKQGEFYGNPVNGSRKIAVKFNKSNLTIRNPLLPLQRKGEAIEEEYIIGITPFAADNMPYFAGGCSPTYLAALTNKGGLYIVKYSDQEVSATATAAAPVTGKAAFDPYSTPVGTSLLNSYSGTESVPKAAAQINLPPSISLISPPARFSQVVSIRKVDWYSICPTRTNHASAVDSPTLLKGGAPQDNRKAPKSIGYDETTRSILITGHDDAIVRLLDISRGEHQEIENVIQLNLLKLSIQGKITSISCAFESKELLVGFTSGAVVICKFGKSKGGALSNSTPLKGNFDDCPVLHSNGDSSIVSVSHRVPKLISNSSTFLPSAVFKCDTEKPEFDSISTLKISDVGFAAIAYKSGKLVVCDITRGPAIIFNCPSILQFLPSVGGGVCYATTLEFSIMEYGQEGYSSIVLIVGTCAGGNLLTFKIIPQPNGAFECVFVDKTIGLNYKSSLIGSSNNNASPEELKLNQIIPIAIKNGESSVAQLQMFHRLSQGVVIPSYVITSSSRDIRVLRLPKQKLSHKVIEDVCLCSGLVRPRGGKGGVILAVLVKSGFLRFLSLPALSEIIDYKLSKDTFLQVRNALESGVACESDILPSGDIYLKAGKSELIIISTFLQDSKLKKHHVEKVSDLLFNETAIIPPRPSAGSLQWVKGQTKYVSVQDLTHLIAGPNRKPTKRDESRLAHNISPEANPNQSYGYALGANPNSGAGGDRGYAAPVRGGTSAASPYNFGTTGFMKSLQTGIESMEETVNGYANYASEAVNETVQDSQKSMYSAAFKNKFGF